MKIEYMQLKKTTKVNDKWWSIRTCTGWASSLESMFSLEYSVHSPWPVYHLDRDKRERESERKRWLSVRKNSNWEQVVQRTKKIRWHSVRQHLDWQEEEMMLMLHQSRQCNAIQVLHLSNSVSHKLLYQKAKGFDFSWTTFFIKSNPNNFNSCKVFFLLVFFSPITPNFSQNFPDRVIPKGSNKVQLKLKLKTSSSSMQT